MDSTQFNWIANFIWGTADDVLRDVYVHRLKSILAHGRAFVISPP